MTFNIIKAAHELAEAKASRFDSFFGNHRDDRVVQSSSSKRKFQEIENDWFRFPLNSIETECSRWRGTKPINEFFLSLAKCQTLTDLTLAASGDETEIAGFQAALKFINFKILRCKSNHPSLFGGQQSDESSIVKGLKIQNDQILGTVKRVLSLCKKYFREKKSQDLILNDLPKDLFVKKGIMAPALAEINATDDELILWASSLPDSLKESMTFFNFARYPNLSPEAPALLKKVFPNISFACFGNLPESLCDVTLVPTSEKGGAFNHEPEISSQGSFPIPTEEEDSEGELVIFEDEEEIPGSKGKEKVVEEAGQEEKISCIPGKVLESETYEKSISEDSCEDLIEIRTNRKILASCSSFFKHLFFGQMREASLNRVYIRDVRPSVFEACMNVLFSKADLKGLSLPVLIEVLKTAHLLELPIVIEKVKIQIIIQIENLKVTEENVQTVCQTYFDLENILKIDQDSEIENAVLLFLKRSLLEVDPSSLKDILVTLINNDLPIIKIIKFLKQESDRQVKKAKVKNTAFVSLFETFIEASLECQGKFLEELLHATSSLWKTFMTPKARLETYFRLLRNCMAFGNVPIPIQRKLFYRMLKEAASKEQEDMILNPRNTKAANARKKAFLEVTEDILGCFGIKVSSKDKDFSDRSIFSAHLFTLAYACQALPHPGKKIAQKLASLAATADDKNRDAKFLSELYKNLHWRDTGKSCRWLAVQPAYAQKLLTLLNPSLNASTHINDFLNLDSLNPVALTLSALIGFYHPLERNWSRIYLQSKKMLIIPGGPLNDLALALFGACTFHFALQDPSKKEAYFKASIAAFKKALFFNSKNSIALLYLANCYLKLGKNSKAIELFKTAGCHSVTRDNEEIIRFCLESSGEAFDLAEEIIMNEFNSSGFGSIVLPEEAFESKDLFFFNLFARFALKKMNGKLLKKAQSFLENFCLAKDYFNEETLTLLKEIYSLERLVGAISDNKKQTLGKALEIFKERSNLQLGIEALEFVSFLPNPDSSISSGSAETRAANDSLGTSGSNNHGETSLSSTSGSSVEVSTASTSGSELTDDGLSPSDSEFYDNLDVDAFLSDMPLDQSEEP
ncbi:BTB/POZ domain-containing protein [Criblamydia sequanensis]|uniref:BTB domain-containing protein n=1 Tax=Candidatus Criblamydia sequanensis CRIB-18 TaxID=1437425 RepID=A0A090DW06_9BACT|nr:BTB/POZ domain-containing protein [Criblamydia sequanensis]CDR33114.1 hypothetical protein CSEC_0275 [Criblamydia sequanensis CRIB-18]